jgi:hypothetical protein
MNAKDAWVAVAFIGALAIGSVATWESDGARFEGKLARAAPRHQGLAGRSEAGVEMVTPAPDPAPPAVDRHLAVAHRPKPPERPAILIELPDTPDPPVGSPSTLDDLFPPLPRGKGSSAPCFDRLQGIGGLSPCPDSTPRQGL